MSELIVLVLRLSELVLQNKRVIQAYYLEYMHGLDKKELNEEISKFASLNPDGISLTVRY